ncbi:MAG: DegT/DnrJ/EryC1/StrS aminotransferase family protein [Spirochaetales bacterium]|nr:DegT/DnrJ/EryC1/StrS aminotransferase family protein [Spirochaetales bacterium]
MSIDLFNPFILRKDMDAVLSCMVSDKIGYGSIANSLISKGCELFSAQNGYAFRDPARAFEVILRGNFEPGATVFVSPLAPDYYRVGAENALCKIEFVDVDPETGCLSYDNFKAKDLTEVNNYLVVLDSPAGNIPNVAKFVDDGVTVVEDVSTTAGISSEEYSVGSLSDYVFLSFEIDSLVTAGGGSLVLARDKKQVGKLNKGVAFFKDYIFLPDLNGALALSQFEQLAKKIDKRKTIYAFLRDAVAKSIHTTLKRSELTENYLYALPMIIDMGMGDVIKYCKKREIEVRPCFDSSILASFADPIDAQTPNALSLFMRCLLFPVHGSINKKDCEYLARVITTLP